MADGHGRPAALARLLSRLMDWLLVLIGVVLLYWACLVVDVTVARWLIGTAGVLLAGAGLLFRYRHWRRHR
ncbi:hypothetical protein ACLG6S_11975 [Thermodesulfobacteriota bacterium B35]